MTAKSNNLKVAALGETLFVRMPERGCAMCARQFEILTAEARTGKYNHLVVELSGTFVVESSMLGALADSLIALGTPGSPELEGYITLLNASPAVRHSLETSGMIDWFEFRDEETPCTSAFETFNTPAEAMSRLEVLKCCLKAHKTLMEISADNIPKFKDVVEFMEQDVQRMEAQK